MNTEDFRKYILTLEKEYSEAQTEARKASIQAEMQAAFILGPEEGGVGLAARLNELAKQLGAIKWDVDDMQRRLSHKLPRP